MKPVSAATRISLSLIFITATIIMAAQAIGLIPDAMKQALQHRALVAETLAVPISLAAQRADVAIASVVLEQTSRRDPDIVSVAIRQPDGTLLTQFGDHAAHWQPPPSTKSTPTQVQMPILRDNKPWGNLEIVFRDPNVSGIFGFLKIAGLPLVLFVMGACFLAYRIYLRKVLKHLDPSAVIPAHVKGMLDNLAEGILVLDRHECIVLVNAAFVKAIERSGDELLGKCVTQIPWAFTALSPDSPVASAPWSESLRTGKVQRRLRVSLKRSQDTRAFMVSTTAIVAPDGSRRGVLASFDDVTWLEDKNAELQKMISLLEESRDTVSFQNEELKKLATRDPLTGCLNRRAFFELIDAAFEEAKRYGGPLACILLDIDHFKVVNDRYGHAAGDQVLQFVAATLHANLRASDRLCRYGGEEFCILLTRADVAVGVQVAEKIREAIAASPCGNTSITASFGVSSLEFNPTSPADMIDQADQALYAAKHQGRNRVLNYSQRAVAPAQAPIADDKNELSVKIPFHAVQALMAVLAQRDPSTAWHSRRVADLCIATVRGLMSASDTFVFEIAALLHDIGKIGVPDAILLKPGPLTADEWDIMEQHARMGIEILDATFGIAELTAIVRNHHAWFGGNRRDPGLPVGEQIPLRSRILSIADAYDAIVSDRIYRKARSHDEAVAELRRCAGTQFDPLLVERFITAVEATDRHGITPTLSLQEERALTIGLATERLASTLVSRDLASVAAQAQHLALSAAKFELPHVAELASELYKTSSVESDILKAMRITQELCQLCQSTQGSTQNDHARLLRSERALHV